MVKKYPLLRVLETRVGGGIKVVDGDWFGLKTDKYLVKNRLKRGNAKGIEGKIWVVWELGCWTMRCILYRKKLGDWVVGGDLGVLEGWFCVNDNRNDYCLGETICG